MATVFVRLLPIIALIVLLFLAGRRIVWWYFGIDRALALLASIDESLKQLPVVRQHDYQKRRG